MRLKTPLVALSSVGLLALAACGGWAAVNAGATPSSFNPGATGNFQDPNAKGPVTIAGAQKGGIVTVLTLTGLHHTIDPSEIYYTDTSSIISGLVGRSLTQYKYDPKSKQMVLVPDLATDLGTHNDNYTKWTFTIRPGVKWENGKPVTAKEVAWGMTRCMDAATFPTGACQYYSNATTRAARTTRARTPTRARSFKGIKVNGDTITINMAKPFPDMPYWGTLPGQRPGPARARSRTRRPTRSTRWSTGPYMIKTFSLVQGAGAGQEPVLGPGDRPGSHAVPRRVRLQAPAAVGEDRPDHARRLRSRSDHADLRRPAGA